PIQSADHDQQTDRPIRQSCSYEHTASHSHYHDLSKHYNHRHHSTSPQTSPDRYQLRKSVAYYTSCQYQFHYDNSYITEYSSHTSGRRIIQFQPLPHHQKPVQLKDWPPEPAVAPVLVQEFQRLE